MLVLEEGVVQQTAGWPQWPPSAGQWVMAGGIGMRGEWEEWRMAVKGMVMEGVHWWEVPAEGSEV